MTTDNTDPRDLTDEDLDDLDGDLAPQGDDQGDTESPATVTEQPAASPAADAKKADEGTQEAQEGPPKYVPLPEHMEQRRRLTERATAAERELETLRQQEAERKAAADLDAARAKYQDLLDEDPEAAADFAAKWHGQRATNAEQQAAQRLTTERLQTAAEVGLELYGQGRYVGAVQRLYGEFGPEWVDGKAAGMTPTQAAKWVVEFAETRLAPSAEASKATFEDAVKAEVARQLKELQGKHTPTPTKATSSVAHVASSVSEAPVKSNRDKTDAELEAEERDWEARV